MVYTRTGVGEDVPSRKRSRSDGGRGRNRQDERRRETSAAQKERKRATPPSQGTSDSFNNTTTSTQPSSDSTAGISNTQNPILIGNSGAQQVGSSFASANSELPPHFRMAGHQPVNLPGWPSMAPAWFQPSMWQDPRVTTATQASANGGAEAANNQSSSQFVMAGQIPAPWLGAPWAPQTWPGWQMMPFPMMQVNPSAVPAGPSQSQQDKPGQASVSHEETVSYPARPPATVTSATQQSRRESSPRREHEVPSQSSSNSRNGDRIAPASGENENFSNANPLVQSVSPLSTNVSKSVKEKIWSHEFVDLGSLLSKNDKTQHMQLQYDDSQGFLVCKQASQAPKILSIEKWTSAFLIFSYVYLDKYEVSHPHKARELLQYMETIRFAASSFPGSGWQQYDEANRRTWYGPECCFASMNGEYWLKYMVPQVKQPALKPSGKGVCFDFNKGRCTRERCNFAHRCATCNLQGHGAHQNQICGKQFQRGRSASSRQVATSMPQPFRGNSWPGKNTTQSGQNTAAIK